jgi:hypothetical protein
MDIGVVRERRWGRSCLGEMLKSVGKIRNFKVLEKMESL